MNEVAKKALQVSIEHWEDNLAKAKNRNLKRDNINSDSCALCTEYVDEMSNDAAGDVVVYCAGCPVSKRTGLSDCKGTPWHDLAYWMRLCEGGKPIERTRANKKVLEYTQEMLDFLRSL